MWGDLAERVLPAALWSDLFKVEWRIVDPLPTNPAGVTHVSFAIPVSRQLLNDGPWDWYGRRWHWKRWPVGSLNDLIPMISTSLAPIEYHRPFTEPPPGPRSIGRGVGFRKASHRLLNRTTSRRTR